MQIAIMNYATSEVTIVNNVPDDWEEGQITAYLYDKDGLNLRDSDVYYMVGDSINLTVKDYCQTKGE